MDEANVTGRVGDLKIRERTGAIILAIIRDEDIISNIGPKDELRGDDTIIAVGSSESLKILEGLLS